MCLVLPREHLGEKDVREVNKEAREQMYSFWGRLSTENIQEYKKKLYDKCCAVFEN